jgi:photosystem II stability/assembly factor-like uncharacterized protein
MWLVAGGVGFVAATVAAFVQPPPDNPLVPTQSFAQWFKEPMEVNGWRRLPYLGELQQVVFVDKAHGWALSERHTILATTDGGLNWKIQYSDISQHFTSLHFADASRGWVVTYEGRILATTDGGLNWKMQYSDNSRVFDSIYFADASHGWIESMGFRSQRPNSNTIFVSPELLATTDGGLNWKHSVWSSFAHFHFTDASHGWALTMGDTILATTDGGLNWKTQYSDKAQRFNSIHFADASHGWAVSEQGTILATIDGGLNWKTQYADSSQSFASVHFADASHGWTVGSTGIILSTNDGGLNWKPQVSATLEPLSSVFFVDKPYGWIVGNAGTLLTTTDSGAHWKPRLASLALVSIHFVDTNHGLALNSDGVLLATADGGRHWDVESLETTNRLWSMSFVDPYRGWAVGSKGTILNTSDGGRSWTTEISGTKSDLYSVFFNDRNNGWVVGTEGTILSTSDGGHTWKTEKSVTTDSLYSVFFVDPNRGWAVGSSNEIFSSIDGGHSWESQFKDVRQGGDLLSVHFADTSRGWAVGAFGRIFATADGGHAWNRQNSGTSELLRAVHFLDASRGWAVGERGTILTTFDGGSNWKPQISGVSTDLNSMQFVDASHGWITGAGGTILFTSDGGQTWQTPDPPSRYPAPWYYVTLLLCLLATVPAFRPEVVIPPEDNAANRQVSDNPIGPEDLDALGLGEIALGLSQFFRNVDTKPPLTVGILGEWGQGKSSVMRLLEADLKKNGVHPVWFNAWHYQKEDHLLAYLLEAIRKQAAPKLQTLQGLRFRARLLGIRASRGRWSVAALVVLAAFCLGLLWRPEAMTTLTEWMKGLGKDLPRGAGQITVFGLSIGTALLFFKQIYEALTAFNVKPAALIKEATGNASIRDLGAKTNLRMAFAREFTDVARALEPYRMVIFIDDLDRCNPRSVTQILESVNFLTSAGNCFVVMGLAKAQVEASLGLSFKDVAEELGDGEDARKKRRDYAQQYLRKLINLEVKVPTATPEQQRVLLTGESVNESKRSKSYAERLAVFGRRNRPVAWVAATLVLAGVSLWVGLNLKLTNPPPPPPPAQTGEPAPTVKPAEPPLPADRQHRERPDQAPTPATNAVPVFVPGIPETRRLVWLPVIPGLVLLGFAVWVLTRRPNEIIHDSRDFTDALEIWQPVICKQFRTPREIKRFLNRVRYIVMRWRRPSHQKTLAERFLDWVQRKKADQEQAGEIKEAGIVLMAAVEGLGGPMTIIDRVVSTPNEKDIELGMALNQHVKRFGELAEDWKRYREITGEVEAN